MLFNKALTKFYAYIYIHNDVYVESKYIYYWPVYIAYLDNPPPPPHTHTHTHAHSLSKHTQTHTSIYIYIYFITQVIGFEANCICRFCGCKINNETNVSSAYFALTTTVRYNKKVCPHRYRSTPYMELNCYNHIVMNCVLLRIDFLANINGISWRFLTGCHMRRAVRSLGNYDLIDNIVISNLMLTHSMPHQICIEFWVGHTIISQWINATSFTTAWLLIFGNSIKYAKILCALSHILADCRFVNYSKGHIVHK